MLLLILKNKMEMLLFIKFRETLMYFFLLSDIVFYLSRKIFVTEGKF